MDDKIANKKKSALGFSLDKYISVVVITVDTIVKTNVRGFRNYMLTMIFYERPMISSEARQFDKNVNISLTSTL